MDNHQSSKRTLFPWLTSQMKDFGKILLHYARLFLFPGGRDLLKNLQDTISFRGGYCSSHFESCSAPSPYFCDLPCWRNTSSNQVWYPKMTLKFRDPCRICHSNALESRLRITYQDWPSIDCQLSSNYLTTRKVALEKSELFQILVILPEPKLLQHSNYTQMRKCQRCQIGG